MKRKDFIKKISEMSAQELTAQSRDLRKEIFNLRLQQANGTVEKPARFRTLRRDVARLETRLSQLRNKAA